MNLKGKTKGDACISNKHANFIVNLGNATAKDVFHLIILAKKAVAKKSAKVVKRSCTLKLKNKNSKSVLKKRKMTDRSKSKPQKSKK